MPLTRVSEPGYSPLCDMASFADNFPEDAVNFAQVHDVNCLIETFPLSKAQEAYEHMQSGKVRFRSVVVMD